LKVLKQKENKMTDGQIRQAEASTGTGYKKNQLNPNDILFFSFLYKTINN